MDTNNTQTKTRAPRRRKVTQQVVEQQPQKPLVEAVHEVFEQYGVSGVLVPSWKRVAAATLVCGALAYGAGYGIGIVAVYAIAGIMTLSGSVLLAFMIAVLAVAIAMYTGAKIGQHVGNYILSGQIDKDFVRTKNKVLGFFRREKARTQFAEAMPTA